MDTRIMGKVTKREADILQDRLLDDEDMYNPILGIYAFRYNDNDAIACYKIDVSDAIELANKARQQNEMWSSLLGVGGTIYDNPEDFISGLDSFSGWVSCTAFLEDHLVFEDDNEAIAWAKKRFKSQYNNIACKVRDTNVWLCNTEQVFSSVDDYMYGALEYLLRRTRKNLPLKNTINEGKEMRDMCLKYYEKTYNMRIIVVNKKEE